jgi:hypothetical protein
MLSRPRQIALFPADAQGRESMPPPLTGLEVVLRAPEKRKNLS